MPATTRVPAKSFSRPSTNTLASGCMATAAVTGRAYAIESQWWYARVVRFLFGLIVGLALGAGGILSWQHFRPRPEETAPAAAPAEPVPLPQVGKKKKTRAAGAGGAGGAAEPVEPGELPAL